jgi:hypothetical protein
MMMYVCKKAAFIRDRQGTLRYLALLSNCIKGLEHNLWILGIIIHSMFVIKWQNMNIKCTG